MVTVVLIDVHDHTSTQLYTIRSVPDPTMLLRDVTYSLTSIAASLASARRGLVTGVMSLLHNTGFGYLLWCLNPVPPTIQQIVLLLISPQDFIPIGHLKAELFQFD